MGCNSRPAEGVAAEIFVVMPDHIVEADGDATIILVDDLVVVPGHPAHAPVIRHVFTGQRVGAQRGPDAVSLPAIVAQAQAAAVGADAAPVAPVWLLLSFCPPKESSELEIGRRWTLTVYPTGPTSLL